MAYTKMRVYVVMGGIRVESIHRTRALALAAAKDLLELGFGDALQVEIRTAQATLEFETSY